jgi:hypothetical protein
MREVKKTYLLLVIFSINFIFTKFAYAEGYVFNNF